MLKCINLIRYQELQRQRVKNYIDLADFADRLLGKKLSCSTSTLAAMFQDRPCNMIFDDSFRPII